MILPHVAVMWIKAFKFDQAPVKFFIIPEGVDAAVFYRGAEI